MIEPMMIGQLASMTGLSVRTLRFYADAGLLPEDGRSAGRYRLFGQDAVARARLIRTLRELGVGLDDIRRVLAAETSLAEVAAEHARALDAQISLLRLRRAALRAFVRSADSEELQLMTDLTALTAEERRRIVEEYLDAVFGDAASTVADKLRMGTPELPEDPSPEQVAAWVELVTLLRDPDFVATSRRMAQQALADRPEPDPAQFQVSQAVGEIAGPAARAGIDPASADALAVVQRLEALGPQPPEPRAVAADRIDAFNDRRVGRYWTLVGIINGWQPDQAPADVVDAWEWYGQALRAHA
jgi:DNA-binding transcriptional MerR regulator